MKLSNYSYIDTINYYLTVINHSALCNFLRIMFFFIKKYNKIPSNMYFYFSPPSKLPPIKCDLPTRRRFCRMWRFDTSSFLEANTAIGTRWRTGRERRTESWPGHRQPYSRWTCWWPIAFASKTWPHSILARYRQATRWTQPYTSDRQS